MRNFVVLSHIIFLSLISISLHANLNPSSNQDNISPNAVIKFDLILPALAILDNEGGIGLSIESKILNNINYQIQGAGLWLNNLQKHRVTLQLNSIGKYYLKNRMEWKGSFTGIYFKISNTQEKSLEANSQHSLLLHYSNFSLGTGCVFGLQFQFNRLSLEPLIGLGFRMLTKSAVYINNVNYYPNWNMQLDGIIALNIGVYIY